MKIEEPVSKETGFLFGFIFSKSEKTCLLIENNP